MTATPLVSPGVEDAVDEFVIELDEFVGDDARCWAPGCEAGVTHLSTHDACNIPNCDEHTRIVLEFVAACVASGKRLHCYICGAPSVDPLTVTARPI